MVIVYANAHSTLQVYSQCIEYFPDRFAAWGDQWAVLTNAIHAIEFKFHLYVRNDGSFAERFPTEIISAEERRRLIQDYEDLNDWFDRLESF